MSAPVVRAVQVTFDCSDPRALSQFWCEALGYVLPAPPGGHDSWDDFAATLPEEQRNSVSACEDPGGVGPRLFFQRVPEPKTTKNRVHVDVRAAPGLAGDDRSDALEAEADRLVALGARRVRRLEADGFNETCLVMADPEGNEFCLD